MSRRREVSEEEAALWQAVTRSIAPLKRRHRRRAAGPAIADVEAKPKASPKPKGPRASPPAAPPMPHPTPPAPKVPALAPLDRRARQRLARGTQSIDDRLDLHGRTQAQAHSALLRFLRKAQAGGARMVLVITGKGSTERDSAHKRGADGERGVLHRQVPQWLSLPEFRALVIGFSAAAIGHGGAGALYVRVRRSRAD
jgi:DNA-nicking Smr family endonuclease